MECKKLQSDVFEMSQTEMDNEVLGVNKRIKSLQKKRKFGCRSGRAQFIKKLWTMVNAESKTKTQIVHWYDQGTAFVVTNMLTFAERVLPLYFDHNNLASFERQMNFYSFAKMGVKENIPSGKRFKKGAPVKFKHTYFRQNAEGNLGLIVRETCPMLHKNMESELEDLCHELKALKKERKELEKKIRGMKTLRSTGRLDSPTKELLNRARKIWSGIISEGGKDEARQVSVKKTKIASKDFYFCPGENDIFKPDSITHTHTWQAIDDDQMSRHFTDAQYDLFGNVPCGVGFPITPKLGDINCAVLSNSITKCPKNLEPNYSFKNLSSDFDNKLMPSLAYTKALLDSSDAFMEGDFLSLDYGSDCNSEITEASYSLHQFEEADEQCYENEPFSIISANEVSKDVNEVLKSWIK